MSQKDNVISIRPAKKPTQKESEKKWSKPVLDIGFNIIPSLLLRAQARIGLNSVQLAILLHLADYWWRADDPPFPSKETLAERLGIGARQVQRQIAELEKAGLVTRVERRAAHKGKLSNRYDLTGLVDRLKELAPEFKEADEQARALKRQVTRKGGLRTPKKQK